MNQEPEQYRTLPPRGKKTIPNAEWQFSITLTEGDEGGRLMGSVVINDAYAAASPANLGRCVAAYVEEQAHKILAERKQRSEPKQ